MLKTLVTSCFVTLAGFEPAIFWTKTRCVSQLHYRAFCLSGRIRTYVNTPVPETGEFSHLLKHLDIKLAVYKRFELLASERQSEMLTPTPIDYIKQKTRLI